MDKKYKKLLSNTGLITLGTFGSKILVFFLLIRIRNEYMFIGTGALTYTIVSSIRRKVVTQTFASALTTAN